MIIFPILLSFLTGFLFKMVMVYLNRNLNIRSHVPKLLIKHIVFWNIICVKQFLHVIRIFFVTISQVFQISSYHFSRKIFSRLKNPTKKNYDSIKSVIALMIVDDVIGFHYYGQSQKSNRQSGVFLLIISLLPEGIFSDTQMMVKNRYSPSINEFFTLINGFTFSIFLIISLILREFYGILQFIRNHHEIGLELLVLSISEIVGQLSIYWTLNNFNNYVPAMITSTRKMYSNLLLIQTLLINIRGFGVVLIGVLIQIYDEWKQPVKED